MRLKLSLHALQDLQNISSYTLGMWGEEQEVQYLNTLYDIFEKIVEAPDQWRFRHNLYPDCQSALCGKHVIYFQQQGATLLVARVLHQQLDVKKHLGNESFEDSE